MVKFTLEKMIALMDKKHNIRNMSVIAHVDHGKSTLSDSLIAAAGILSLDEAGTRRILDDRPDEALRGVTIKSSGISLHFDMEGKALPAQSEGTEFLINLIDCPGHVDFSSEVTAALRVTDGALVVVDCVEGCCVQTETVLRQALAERIKPVLTINKLDRAFLELQLPPEEMYQSFARSIESVNAIISSNTDPAMGDLTLHPERGTVAFSAGLQGWAFTIQQFARIYAKKFGVKPEKLAEKLWGDWFYDTESRKWQTTPISPTGQVLPRGFCKFIIEPIGKIFKACQAGDLTELDTLCQSLNVQLKAEERSTQKPKELIKFVMRKWLPAADGLLEMIVCHLPSPAQAMKYRVEVLYTGPLDDETANAIRNCDPQGPLVMFISKHIPTKDNSRFFSFGRVFSGTISTGQKVRLLGPSYEVGKKTDLWEEVTVQRTVLMMGSSKQESVPSVPCGNTLALVGIDTYLNKSATVTSSKDSLPLRNMKYSVSPVVRVAVRAKNAVDIPKLVEGLKRLVKSDPLVEVSLEPTGEHVVACAGELHLEICLNDLRDFMNGGELVASDPVVSLKETILDRCDPVLSKSANKHNRLYFTAEPLSDELIAAIELGQVGAKDEPKSRARVLADQYAWDVNEARKIWAFGPLSSGPNILVDTTRAVQGLSEIKDSIVASFEWVTTQGVLAQETLRGVRFNVQDVMLHPDAIHRGGGQIIPTARRCFYAAQLMSKPALLEPIFLVDIQCPQTSISGVHSCLSKRRGQVFEETRRDNGLYNLKCHLPVMESFGFTAALRAATSGQAFPQCGFDHWKLIGSDPLEPDSKAQQIVNTIRTRKGLPKDIPALDTFLDKL